MSSRNNNKHSKFCKFCKDSGKNEAIYTSHNVKDKNGITCCPILVTTLCNNCRVFGHTVKFCKAIINENNKNTKNIIQKPTQIRVEIKKKNEIVNRFAAFEDDDEDEEPVKCEPEKDVKKEQVYVTSRRRIENWADECSDSDDE